MGKYTLVYFGGRGRGEPIRMAFAVAGEAFEDKRVGQDDWPKEKPNAPQGRLPYLIFDGKKVSQSKAILRFLGRSFKLYGKDDMDALYIDEVIDTSADLFEEWVKAFFGDADKKEENMKKFKAETVLKFFDMLENCVKQHGKNGFAVGDKISIADLLMYTVVEAAGTEALAKYPSLKANRETVEKNDKLAKWLKTRPKTDF